MSKYSEETIVILGLTLRDASDEYRRLFAQEPMRVMGRRVVVASTGSRSPRKLDGLRVHDWSETPGAARGRHYADAIESIKIGGATTT